MREIFGKTEENNSDTAKNFTLLPSMLFLHDAILEIKNESERIWIMSMDMQTGHAVSLLQNELMKAARRGVDTKIYLSKYALDFTDDIPHHFLLGGYMRDEINRFQEKMNKKEREDLILAGAKILFEPKKGIAKYIPYAGENHTKIFLIGQKTGYIGGINLKESGFRSADFMVKITDPIMLKELENRFLYLPEKDYKISFEDGSSILIDRGTRGRSITLETDEKNISETNGSINIATAWLPDGNILSILIKLHKEGKKVEVITGNPKGLKNLMELANNSSIEKVKKAKIPIFIYQGPIHTKMYIRRQLDGSPLFRFGSHNITRFGVIIETSELSMQTQNENLTKQAEAFYQELRKKSIPL
ncbi:MAG: phospholipase D-like domain-containing protein [Candidatus Levybacteria bacterium]|nr:phospholipase D-like domain-containing protein [Candidatus Levybacteria bacterium]